MDEFTVDAFANRDEPIPVVSIPTNDGAAEQERTSTSPAGAREKLKSKLSINKDKHGAHGNDDGQNGSSGLSLQDRLFAKLLQQVVPAEDVDHQEPESADKRSSKRVTRPPFSLPAMTNNFRRFNARIGIAFVFQARMIRLFSWRFPTRTLSFLAMYSFVCLNPYLLPVLPLAVVLLFIMVPAFLARHPPPPSTSTLGTTPYYSYQGPALAPARTIKPASETSKDFFRNMRDLQNSMADFANMHDALVAFLAPPTNFSDETLSSTVFLLVAVITASLFLIADILPWRFIFLLGGNAAVIAGHPAVQQYLNRTLERDTAEPNPASQKSPGKTSALPTSASSLNSVLEPIANISLDSSPEEREVEIFELQHRSISPYSTSSEWEALLFCPSPYDPLSPSRIAGDRPRGCRFFEDVQAPSGWAWKGKKWELDLECREWVVERMITGVGFEVPGSSTGISSTVSNDQVGGWVWDLPPSSWRAPVDDDELSVMGYGDLDDSRSAASTSKADLKEKVKGKAKSIQTRDWEESSQVQGTGEWRRRRWVRVVNRVSVPGSEKNSNYDPDRD